MVSQQQMINWDTINEVVTDKKTTEDFAAMPHSARFDYLYLGRCARHYLGYLQWQKDNGATLAHFFEKCDLLWSRGWRQYSSKNIVEVIRWDHDIKKGPGEQFIINNNYVAFMARDWILLHPERFGFFEMRRLGRR